MRPEHFESVHCQRSFENVGSIGRSTPEVFITRIASMLNFMPPISLVENGFSDEQYDFQSGIVIECEQDWPVMPSQ